MMLFSHVLAVGSKGDCGDTGDSHGVCTCLSREQMLLGTALIFVIIY